MKGCVPSESISRVLRRYISPAELTWINNPQKEQPTDSICERASVSPATLRSHLEGRKRWMWFDTADRLLCAMNLVHLWHEPYVAENGEVHHDLMLAYPNIELVERALVAA